MPRKRKSPLTTYVGPNGETLSKADWANLKNFLSVPDQRSDGNGFTLWVEWKGAEVESDTRDPSTWRIWYVRVSQKGSWPRPSTIEVVKEHCRFFPSRAMAEEYAAEFQRNRMGFRHILYRDQAGELLSKWAHPSADIPGRLNQADHDALSAPKGEHSEAGSW